MAKETARESEEQGAQRKTEGLTRGLLPRDGGRRVAVGLAVEGDGGALRGARVLRLRHPVGRHWGRRGTLAWLEQWRERLRVKQS